MTRCHAPYFINITRGVYHYVRLCYHIISIKFVKATRKILFNAELKWTYLSAFVPLTHRDTESIFMSFVRNRA